MVVVGWYADVVADAPLVAVVGVDTAEGRDVSEAVVVGVPAVKKDAGERFVIFQQSIKRDTKAQTYRPNEQPPNEHESDEPWAKRKDKTKQA